MKGQYLTLEWTFFFGVGVTLVILVFMMFTTIDDTYRETVIKLQLQRSGEIIRSGIVNSFESSKSSGEATQMNVSIPAQLSRCLYTIEVSDKLYLKCVGSENLKAVLSLYGINTNSQDIIYSTNGIVKITASNGAVQLS